MKTTHTHEHQHISVNDLSTRLCAQITERYGVDQRLASEMAWDLLELMTAIDGNLETLDTYYVA